LSIQEGVASRNLPSQFSARPHRIVCTGDPTYAKKIAGMCWAEVLSRLNSWVENSSMSFYASSAGHLAIFPKSGHSDRPALGGSESRRVLPACCSVMFRLCNGGLPPKATNELILFIPRERGIIGAQTFAGGVHEEREVVGLRRPTNGWHCGVGR
jgi:hypothetical protein